MTGFWASWTSVLVVMGLVVVAPYYAEWWNDLALGGGSKEGKRGWVRKRTESLGGTTG